MAEKQHRTTEDLRNVLFEAIEGVRSGDMTPSQGNLVVKLASAILDSAKVELDASLVAMRLELSKTDVKYGPILLTGKEVKRLT